MAVASFVLAGHQQAPRNFSPPKRAHIRAWYQAATKGFANVPKWEPHFEGYADVSEETIIFTCERWTLFIARAKYLRS